jgi:hypothetical protein
VKPLGMKGLTSRISTFKKSSFYLKLKARNLTFGDIFDGF